MPTKDEFEALFVECDHVLTTVNGVNSIKFTGRFGYASNSVFLPAAGYYNWRTGTLHDQGSVGYYWSSTPDVYLHAAWYLRFRSVEDAYLYSENPSFCHSVRAVLAEK